MKRLELKDRMWDTIKYLFVLKTNENIQLYKTLPEMQAFLGLVEHTYGDAVLGNYQFWNLLEPEEMLLGRTNKKPEILHEIFDVFYPISEEVIAKLKLRYEL